MCPVGGGVHIVIRNEYFTLVGGPSVHDSIILTS
jgi:hypothetical protein